MSQWLRPVPDMNYITTLPSYFMLDYNPSIRDVLSICFSPLLFFWRGMVLHKLQFVDVVFGPDGSSDADMRLRAPPPPPPPPPPAEPEIWQETTRGTCSSVTSDRYYLVNVRGVDPWDIRGSMKLLSIKTFFWLFNVHLQNKNLRTEEAEASKDQRFFFRVRIDQTW